MHGLRWLTTPLCYNAEVSPRSLPKSWQMSTCHCTSFNVEMTARRWQPCITALQIPDIWCHETHRFSESYAGLLNDYVRAHSFIERSRLDDNSPHHYHTTLHQRDYAGCNPLFPHPIRQWRQPWLSRARAQSSLCFS